MSQTYIHMRPLTPSELPSHPDLASHQTAAKVPALQTLAATILDEGRDFLTRELSSSFKVQGSDKHSSPATAPIKILSYQVKPKDSPVENWFARESVHENASKAGTASWEEFDQGLRANHSQNEKAYTPDVVDAHQVLTWEQELQDLGKMAGSWQEVDAYVMEMVHKVPPPLAKRVFSVLVVTAKKGSEFIEVQIPVDLSGVGKAKYQKDSRVVHGIYCSVERGELVEQDAKVKWVMGTASDAKGVLPMWVQKSALPGAVAKDVGLVMEWIEKKRHGKA